MDILKLAGAATRIYASYQKLEPSTKTSISANIQALKAQWMAVDAAFSAYNSADTLSKFSAVIAIIGAISTAVPELTKIYADGATVFGADWAVVQPDIDLIINILKGTTT